MPVSQFGSSTPWAKAVQSYSKPKAKPVAKPKAKAKTTLPVPPMEQGATMSLDNTMMPSGATTQPTTPWSLETDPVYRSGMAAGQSAFNYARNAALAEKQTQTTQLGQQRKATDTAATESRRRLAGNYAARGMAGGAAGALTQAEARANAEQIAAQTSIADQIAALNNQFLQNFGDVTNANYDWTGTLTGQQYKTQAAQQALEAALARYGTV